jgi:hypothetical protein
MHKQLIGKFKHDPTLGLDVAFILYGGKKATTSLAVGLQPSSELG